MRKLKALTVALALASATLAGRWILDPQSGIGAKELVGLLLLLAVSVLAESKPIQLPPSKDRNGELTLSGLSSYAMVALFPPLFAAAAAAAAVLVAETLIRRRTPLHSGFDTLRSFLAVAAAAAAYGLVLRHPPALPVGAGVSAMACAVLAHFLASRGLAALAAACLDGSPLRATRTADLRWEILCVLCSLPLALLLVLAYERLWIAGPFLFVGPLFLLRESYVQYVRLKTNYTETVRTLIKVIETHDTYTAGHSLRVAEYAKRLALAMRLPAKEIDKVEIAAYLHDLGKVHLAITDLVRKPGRLTPEELRKVQLHPVVSAELAAQVTAFRGQIEAIIRYHHENHDGTGYPYGVRGEAIPVGARILHLVDAFDAMTTSRVYRNALDLDAVKRELRACAGTQFDPQAVSVFLEACATDESMILQQIEPAYEHACDGAAVEPELPEDSKGFDGALRPGAEPLFSWA